MNIICSKETLLENINIVLKAVPTRTTLPILECVLIIAKDNDKIKFLANNLEMGIETADIEATVIKQGSVAVNSRIFADIIRKLPNGNISINSTGNLTTIKGGRSEFKLASQLGDDFPKLPDISDSEAYQLQTDVFKEMIKQTIFSVSLDESKPVLMGELLEIKNNRMNVVALDGFRIAFKSVSVPDDYKNANVVIPGKTLADIVRIISTYEDSQMSMRLTDKHALFELDYCKIVTRLIDGKFINYENIFTDEHTTSITVNRQNLLDSVERASLISKDKTPIKFKISDDVIIITSNTELDASYEELPIVMDGETLDIAFNPKYFVDVLKAITVDEIKIQFTTSLNPCIIKPDDDSKYLILPLRLRD